MKIKGLLIGGLSLVFALASCSLDEVRQTRDTDDAAITFKPVVPYTSRASVTTTDNLETFSVWAWSDHNEFMDAVTAMRNGTVFTTSPLYFWPSGTVDFYAVSPEIVEYGVMNNVEYALIGGEIVIDEDDEGGEHWKYEGNVVQATIDEDNIMFNVYVPGEASKQIDLCYAITKGQTAGSVPINFRHALSQIVFKARNTNDEMTIKIAGVSVCSVYKHGTYTLNGVGSTTENLPTPDIGTGGLTGTQGSWGVEEHKARFAADITATTLKGLVNDNVRLTTEDGNLMLLPQTVPAWEPYEDEHDSELGAYIRILCNISEDGSQLWPNTLEEEDYVQNPSAANMQVIDGVEYGEIAIPVDIEWEEGYRYTYNIIFGEGAGYYPPDDPNYELDGTPILYPITFDVTVDEFQNAEGVDVGTDTEFDFGDEGDGDDGDDDDDGDDGDDNDDDDGDDTNPDDSVLPYITDAGFKSYVLENFDFDSNGYVSFDEVATVTAIECHTATDFAGIEYFTALESFTSYSVVTIDLSKNSELTSIELSAGPNSGNLAAPIVSLDLSGNTKLTDITDYAFYYCTSLEEITFPSSLISIGERAFQECTSLKAIALPDGFTTLGGYAFDSCSSLAEANFPEKLETIGNYAFNGTGLTTVMLPASVTSIGSYAFSNSSLVSIDFSKTALTAMPASVCNYCSHLTSVELPDTLTDLGNMTFYHCTRLETITIPAGVTSIGNQTFRNCSGMLTMYCLPSAPPSLGTDTFRSFSSYCVLYVPTGSVDAYETAWGSYFTSVEAIEN